MSDHDHPGAGANGPLIGDGLPDHLHVEVVGRQREAELVLAALHAGRHLLLEGPPGTGKSTLLRSLANAASLPFEFVEGNAELTPGRLIGHHDPSRVLAEGYSADIFIDGPLAAAMRAGALLYVEEINRVPEETLNVLITAMSEGELHVPRSGRLVASDGFRLVAAMNPFDTVGTARIASAIYDRTCRVLMDYQSPEAELEIVARSTEASPVDDTLREQIVDLVRRTRSHPDVRIGSSVRGAIDLALVAVALARLRGRRPADGDVSLDAALTALSGRLRLQEGSLRTTEGVIRELWQLIFAPDQGHDAQDAGDQTTPQDDTSGEDDPAGKARRPGGTRHPTWPTPPHSVPPARS